MSVLLACTGCMGVNTSMLDSSTPQGMLSMLLAGGSVYLAVGVNCESWVSSDGKNWAQQGAGIFPSCNSASGGLLNDVIYAGGQFTVVGRYTSTGGCGIWTSRDGRGWTARPCAGINTVLNSITYNSSTGRYIAAGDTDGTTPVCNLQTSVDGSTWTQITGGPACVAVDSLPAATLVKTGVSSAVFVVSCQNCGGFTAYVSSDDAASWPNGITPGFTASGFLPVGSGSLLAYTNSSPLASYSPDGFTAAGNMSTGLTGMIRGAAYRNSSSTIVGVGLGCYLSTSTDNGVSFTETTMPGCSGVDWNTVVANSATGILVAGGNLTSGQKETFAYSENGPGGPWTIQTLTNGNNIYKIAIKP